MVMLRPVRATNTLTYGLLKGSQPKRLSDPISFDTGMAGVASPLIGGPRKGRGASRFG